MKPEEWEQYVKSTNKRILKMHYPEPTPKNESAAILASQIAGTLRATLPGQDRDWYRAYVYNCKKIDDATWIPLSKEYPPENIFVETRINDRIGIRNTQVLKRQGNLFFNNDGIYMYYMPNEWRPIQEEKS